MIHTVIADLAGTTIDHGSSAPAGAFVELFQRHGITITAEQAREPMGLDKRSHIRAIATMDEVAVRWPTSNGGRGFTEKDIDALYAEFIPLQLEILPRYGEIIPGVVEVASWLRSRRVNIAVTTGYNRAMMEVVLDCAARQDFVPDAACCAADVAAGRPAPWMIYRCMEHLGSFPPAMIVNLGDTLPDVMSGRNAGTWSVGVVMTGNMIGLDRREISALDPAELARRTQRGRQAMLEAGAHYVIDGIDKLPELIEEINGRIALGDKP